MKNYIDFKSAKCRDCYRCLKACPVKAIRLTEHQARIINERCIQCGNCTRVCPQGAKNVHSELDSVVNLLHSGRQVIASVAPSFISSFSLKSFEPMRSALISLGFSDAEETAVGAAAVTEEYTKLLESGKYKNLITSSCAAVDRLIQLYYPEALKYLAPVDTPLVAHVKMIKSRCPEAAVVFVGPCIAKKREADESHIIDYVLTFEELETLMRQNYMDFDGDSSENPPSQGASARIYPIGGGIYRSMKRKVPGYEYLYAETTEKCKAVLGSIEQLENTFIELNACEFGCINGPCSAIKTENAILGEVSVRRYAESGTDLPVSTDGVDLEHIFPRIYGNARTPTEDEIRSILAKTGKNSPEDELNCGACGYSSCREKAWAVANGFADENLCIPYMRSKAESVTTEVLRRMPFGIVVLNSSFCIESINRSAINILGISAFHPEGRMLFDFVSIPDFVIAQSSNSNILGKRTELPGGKVVDLSVILLKEHSRLLGIMKDVTEEESYNEKLKQVQEETYKVTDDVVKKQMRIAQEIASLLGETTAETKVALLKLKGIMQDKG